MRFPQYHVGRGDAPRSLADAVEPILSTACESVTIGTVERTDSVAVFPQGRTSQSYFGG